MASRRWASGRAANERELDPADLTVAAPHPPRASWRRLLAGGSAGNEQLTTAAGLLLVVLLAALGVTIVRIRPLLAPHMFIGLLLIPLVLLKMASTGYRFVRYYTHDPAYRREGPPPTPLRVLAPAVVVSTVVVFATGVALLLIGPSSRGSLLGIHKVSFIVWLVLTALHVLGHLPELGRALPPAAEPRAWLSGSAKGGGGRLLSLAGVLVAGVVLAILYIPQFTPWLHAHHAFGAR
jgi:hypothetical protein